MEAYRRGNYVEAQKQWATAVTEAERFEPEDLRLATSLNNLAGLYQAQGKYAEAEPLHLRALGIREMSLGPKYPYVAQSLENYAAVLRKTGRVDEAEKIEARAKAIRAKSE